MADVERIRALYEENLAGRTFLVYGTEIGGRAQEECYLRFESWNLEHLIGADSSWHESKISVLGQLCYPSQRSWNMFGDYNDNMGTLLQADILVGSANGVLGFVYDEEDGLYHPCTCLKTDIRDNVYVRYHTDGIEECC